MKVKKILSAILSASIAISIGAIAQITPNALGSENWQDGADKFSNPICNEGADPYVVYHDGYYYAMKTETPLVLYRSTTLENVYQSEDKKVIDTTTVEQLMIWAPEIHFWNGKAYINLSINNGNQTAVLESVTDDPMGEYTEKNHELPGIDWSYYEGADGTLWGLMADWNGGNGIKIAEMENPYTIKGNKVTLVTPTEEWEKLNNNWVEGPFVFEHDGRIFLNYSAGGYVTDNYAIGLVTFTGSADDRLDDASKWTKSTTPVFQSANGVTGPGHNSVVKTADGNEYWNVYHDHPYSGTTQREIAMDLITWDENGMPDFGKPSGHNTLINSPSSITMGATSINGSISTGVATQCFSTEFNYTANEFASEQITYNVNENSAITAISENFEKYDAGTFVKGLTDATVNVVNSDITGHSGMVAQIGEWKENTYIPYDGGSFDGSFYIAPLNADWVKMRINLKNNVFLALDGNSIVGGQCDTLKLCSGKGIVNDTIDASQIIGSVNLSTEYGIKVNIFGCYLRVIVTDNNVKVYVSPVNSFNEEQKIMDVNLADEYCDNSGFLKFSQSNTKFAIDDINVKTLSGDKLTFSSIETGNANLTKEIDFINDVEQPNDSTIKYLDGHGLTAFLNQNTGAVSNVYNNIVGDFTVQFYIDTPNYDWDQFNFYLCDGYYVALRGTQLWGDSIYSASIIDNAKDAIITKTEPKGLYPTDGCYIKISVIKGKINVYFSKTTEFSSEPLLSADCDKNSQIGRFSIWRWDQTAYIDDIVITSACGNKVLYSNNYEGSQYISMNNAEIEKTTAGSRYHRLGDWTSDALFDAPNNYDMTFSIQGNNWDWQMSKLYIRNDINLSFLGKKNINLDNPAVVLRDGDTNLADPIQIPSIQKLNAGNLLFDNKLFVRVVLNGNHLVVYLGEDKIFTESEKYFDITINDYQIYHNKITVYNGNSALYFDDFTVRNLDLPSTVIMNRDGYNQIEIIGNTILIKDISGSNVETLKSYNGLVKGKTYRIGVVKTDGELNVFLNGIKIEELTTEDSSSGLVYNTKAGKAIFKNSAAEPFIVKPGDLDMDGVVMAKDLVNMRKVLLDIESQDSYVTFAVDANSDNDINIKDLVHIKKLTAE